MGPARPLLLTAGMVFAVDQLLKVAIVFWLDLINRGSIDVLPPYLNLRMAWNRGVNFGLFAGDSDVMRWFLVGLAVAISAWVVWWMLTERPGRRAMISGGLLVGGALGNGVDRVLYGAVADFLNMSCCGINNPYAFNVADISIFLGAIGLVLFASGDAKARDDGAKGG
ncbi:MAG: signal peptidase II [Paracoccaceae bacterium]|nr:signal peptidase II [Paracoccaceae bacterium]